MSEKQHDFDPIDSEGIPLEVKGILIPSEWDQQGIHSIALCAFDEQEYPIELDHRGKELMDLIRQKVSLQGILKSHGLGKRVLQVTHYQVLPW